MKRLFTTICAATLIACAPTPGREVTVRYSFAADAPATFTNALGWEVTLTSAALRAGPLHLFENPPPVAAGPLDRLWSLVMPSAVAHAGEEHFNGGRCLTEWLETRSFDLLSNEALPLGEAPSDAGEARSFSLLFEKGTPGDTLVGEPVLRLEGTATKGGTSLRFIATVIPGEAKLERRVQGAPAQVALDEGTEIRLVAHPSQWLRYVDFSSAPTPDDDGTVTIDGRTIPGAALAIGLRSSTAFTLDTP